MKKIILTVAALIIIGVSAAAQSPAKVEIKKDGNTFVATKKAVSDGYKATDYYYKDTDGKTYQIYVHTVSKGEHQGQTKCYIQKVSRKSGKPYWKEIPVKPEDLRY